MIHSISDCKRIDIYVDEKNNIVVFPMSISVNTVVESRRFFELKKPYSIQDVADIIEKGINAYGKCEAYENKNNTVAEFYYGIKGFKKATCGKRLIGLGWDDIGGKYVDVSMPSNKGKYYIGLKSVKLSNDADWLTFAKVVMDLISLDLSQLETYKTFKKMLNI